MGLALAGNAWPQSRRVEQFPERRVESGGVTTKPSNVAPLEEPIGRGRTRGADHLRTRRHDAHFALTAERGRSYRSVTTATIPKKSCTGQLPPVLKNILIFS